MEPPAPTNSLSSSAEPHVFGPIPALYEGKRKIDPKFQRRNFLNRQNTFT
jgi:hypothetical protein